MDFINLILKDFYDCCLIPTKVIDLELNEIASIGYNDYFNSLYPSKEIATNLDDSNDFVELDISINNEIYFLIISVSKFNSSRGYFVVGPVTFSKEVSLKEKIPYKSKSALPYIAKLLINIYDDKFSVNINKVALNPHVRKAIEYVHKNYLDPITIEDVCYYLNINKSYFCSIFKKETGFTFSNFLNSFRIEKSKNLLLNRDMSLLDIAISVGFNNQNYYSMVFKKITNQSPSQYRANTVCEDKKNNLIF